jgi:hypothetical protein
LGSMEAEARAWTMHGRSAPWGSMEAEAVGTWECRNGETRAGWQKLRVRVRSETESSCRTDLVSVNLHFALKR